MRSTLVKAVTTLLSLRAVASAEESRSAPDGRFHREKITYGTYTLPPSGQHVHQFPNLPALHGIFTPLESPCDDCIITYMEAHLEHMDGRWADFNTGVWMHHVVLLNQGRKERVCHEGVERFFFAGNERTPFDFTATAEQGQHSSYGYYLNSTEGLYLYADFMNEHSDVQNVTFSMTWEYTKNPDLLETMQRAEPYWLDVAPKCSDSDMPNHDQTQFQYSGAPVQAKTGGQLATGYGHVHEGGVSVDVSHNNRSICTIEVTHAKEPDKDGIAHLKPLPHCSPMGRVEENDAFGVEVKYDTVAHKPMRMPNGELEPAMGIALVWLIPDSELSKNPSSTGLAAAEESSPPPTANAGNNEKLSASGHPFFVVLGGAAVIFVGVFVWLRRRSGNRSEGDASAPNFQYKRIANDAV